MQEISRIVHKSSMPEPLNKDFRRGFTELSVFDA